MDDMPNAAVDNRIYRLLLEGILADLKRIEKLGVSDEAKPEIEGLIDRIARNIE